MLKVCDEKMKTAFSKELQAATKTRRTRKICAYYVVNGGLVSLILSPRTKRCGPLSGAGAACNILPVTILCLSDSTTSRSCYRYLIEPCLTATFGHP